MRRSDKRILVTHVGALPGDHELWSGTHASAAKVNAAVKEVVAFQKSAGVDFINEGELTKGGNWVRFVNARLSGFEPAKVQGKARALFVSSADWKEFGDFYASKMKSGTLFEDTGAAPRQVTTGDETNDWACTSEIEYVGEGDLRREIAALKNALGDTPASDAFLTSTAPQSIETGRVNEFYKTEEEWIEALAEALRVEYEAIAAAGFQVQIDDAWLPALWDRIGIGMGLAAYKKFCMLRIEALNHALRNVPEEQVRYHLCWGSWHGPHAHDIPMKDIVDIMLAVKAQTYLFEAANVRHEHEIDLWERVKLPAGKILAPGVVTHSTVLIEHPELVASRIKRFAKMVGRENVIAATDCGLGLRCHPQIAWAKLKALSDGAALASKELY